MTKELRPCPFCGGTDAAIVMTKRVFDNALGYLVMCADCGGAVGLNVDTEFTAFTDFGTEAEAAEAWNTRAATTIGQVAVEVVPTVRACRMEPLNAFYTDLNGLNQTEWGVCSNCGTASPIDATYCCECGRKVER